MSIGMKLLDISVMHLDMRNAKTWTEACILDQLSNGQEG